MAISKKKDSPYYYTRFSICGVRVQESTRATSRREAEEYEEKRRRDIRGQVLLGKKPEHTWPEAVIRWVKEMSHKKSLCTDAYIFEWLSPRLDKYTLSEITKEVIEGLAVEKAEEGTVPSTVNRKLCLIRAVLNRAYKKWEWLDRVPHFNMRHVDNKRIRFITKEEAARLLKELPEHLRVMAEFTLATGLRRANVTGLQWQDVDLKARHTMIYHDQAKGKKAIPVPLNADAMRVLYKQKGKHEQYVFTYQGKRITQCSTKAFRSALKRAKIKNFRWHDLRHTWASWHVQNGTSLHELQQLGSWQTFDMVLRYAHLSSTHLRDAANRISTKGKRNEQRN
jgi:integrase